MTLQDEIFPTPSPPKKPRRRTPKKDLEGAVVRECLAFLHADPNVAYIERRNTGAVAFQGGGFLRFGSKGAADIWCLIRVPQFEFELVSDIHFEQIDGKTYAHQHILGKELKDDDTIGHLVPSRDEILHIEIECKRADGKGRLSADQKIFQEFCEKSGIPYFIVTSAEMLKKCLDKLTESC